MVSYKFDDFSMQLVSIAVNYRGGEGLSVIPFVIHIYIFVVKPINNKLVLGLMLYLNAQSLTLK